MATWYAQSNDANWDAASLWNSAANGSGTAATWADGRVGDVGDTCNLNGKTNLLLNRSTQNAIFEAAAGFLRVEDSRTITGNITQNGSLAAGLVKVNGGTLTVNGQVSANGAGSGIYVYNSANAIISDVGGTALSSTYGSALYMATSGAVTVNGNAVTAGSSYGDAAHVVLGTLNFNGDINVSPSLSLGITGGSATANGVVINFNGTFTGNGGSAFVLYQGATLNWTGQREIAVGCSGGVCLTPYAASPSPAAINLEGLMLRCGGGFYVYQNTDNTNVALTVGSGNTLATMIETSRKASIGIFGATLAAAAWPRIVRYPQPRSLQPALGV